MTEEQEHDEQEPEESEWSARWAKAYPFSICAHENCATIRGEDIDMIKCRVCGASLEF